jgi:hypothetical protein
LSFVAALILKLIVFLRRIVFRLCHNVHPLIDFGLHATIGYEPARACCLHLALRFSRHNITQPRPLKSELSVCQSALRANLS